MATIFVNSVCNCLPSLPALHGTRRPFNQLQAHGNLKFPDASIRLPDFGRRANVPHINFPAAFFSAARRTRREESLEVNGTVKSDAMLEVVNVVMNNIEDYLPADTAIKDVNER